MVGRRLELGRVALSHSAVTGAAVISSDRWRAVMDPWILVDTRDSKQVLFGFCMRHPETGGLSWTRSTPVVYLYEKLGLAQTASGRHYVLGARISPAALPTEEAQLAFSLLVGAGPLDLNNEALSAKGYHDAAEWIRACKVARHLKVEPPKRRAEEVARFMSAHLGAYLALRARGGDR